MRIVVLGGYGHFGGRICRSLAAECGWDLIVAGRDSVRGQRFVAGLGATRSPARAVALDAQADDLAAQLVALAPGIVIHSAGPFQGRDYRVAEACLAAGAHCIDLADGRDFVAGIGRLDARAREAGRWIVSGASSVPGLSAAVVEAYRSRFQQLRSIEAGIRPGNRTPRGAATTRSILGYVGRPYRILQQGQWREVHGWQSLRRIDVPGLGPQWLARCEVPDLSVLPARYPELEHCDFRAGLELRRMHFGLWLASWLVRAGLLRGLPGLASPLLALSERWLPLGSDVGSMVVDMRGSDHQGRALALRWSLLARDGDGPQVPCTAALVLARKLASGALAGGGARPCLDLFGLDEFLRALEGFAVETALTQLEP